jgi:hypothetical protein
MSKGQFGLQPFPVCSCPVVWPYAAQNAFIAECDLCDENRDAAASLQLDDLVTAAAFKQS